MNSKERREYYRTWSAFQVKQEKSWFPKIYRALQSNMDAFAAYMLKNGVRDAQAMIDSIVKIEPIMDVLQRLYVQVGVRRGRIVRQDIKRNTLKLRTMGVNEQLTLDILKYFELNLLNKSVIPITNTQKQHILQILSKGTAEGWSVEQMAREITGSPYTRRHARLVVRTETVRAANAGGYLAAQRSDFVLDHEWISAHDDRVRRPPKSKFDHWDLDGQVVPGDRPFFSGGEELWYPGDPNGSAGNVINCRCCEAFIPRRDANGRLIRRQPRIAAMQNQSAPGLPVVIPDSSPNITVLQPTVSNITEIITVGLRELFEN
jgi:hypothetical protein